MFGRGGSVARFGLDTRLLQHGFRGVVSTLAFFTPIFILSLGSGSHLAAAGAFSSTSCDLGISEDTKLGSGGRWAEVLAVSRAQRKPEETALQQSVTSSSCCPGGAYRAGEIIVSFEEGTTLERVEEIVLQVGALVITQISSPTHTSLIGVPIGEEVLYLALFEAFPEVPFASLNRAVCIPIDPPCECCPCGLICSDLPPCPDTCPGAVPDGRRVAGLPLTAELSPGGQIVLNWDTSCSAIDVDYEIYEGVIGEFFSHEPKFCSTAAGTSAIFTPAVESSYYLVVPRSADQEGSYGITSNRVERPRRASACLLQTVGRCPYTCPHSRCVLGGPLAPDCDTCVAAICEVDAYCCTTEWDEHCVADVRSICNERICAQPECEQAGGFWTLCGPPDPECFCPGVFCAQVCVSECLCGGFEGYTCPVDQTCNIAACSPDRVGICQ